MKEGLDKPSIVNTWCGPAGTKKISSDLLVPGDVLDIPTNANATSLSEDSTGNGSASKSSAGAGKDASGKVVGWKVPADVVLVSGACIVNESSLSGTLSATVQLTDYSKVYSV